MKKNFPNSPLKQLYSWNDATNSNWYSTAEIVNTVFYISQQMVHNIYNDIICLQYLHN